MLLYAGIFILVAIMNVIPFFMPATWTVLTLLALSYELNLFTLVIIGAVAATIGRVALAKLSRTIIRERFLKKKTRDNIDSIRILVERHKITSFSTFLAYAFSPLPTNQLFIAYGLTNMPLRYLTIPFFIGRIVSYGFWTFSASSLKEILFPESLATAAGIYFIAVQILTILVVYIFTRINWRKLARKKHLFL
jgi:membrane protein DedA with SNARE-associated domain